MLAHCFRRRWAAGPAAESTALEIRRLVRNIALACRGKKDIIMKTKSRQIND